MRQENTDEKRLAIENDRLTFDCTASHRAARSSVDLRLNLDERRLDLESSERRDWIELGRQALQLASEKRRAMIDLRKELAEK